MSRSVYRKVIVGRPPPRYTPTTGSAEFRMRCTWGSAAMLIIVRLSFLLFCLVIVVVFRPATLPLPVALASSTILAGLAILCEARLKLLGSARSGWLITGTLAGVLAGAASAIVLQSSVSAVAWHVLLPPFCLLFFGYSGAWAGAGMADHFTRPATPSNIAVANAGTAKVLDTSTIIDGRIADVADAGFLDGPVIVAEFILRELQAVADSTDASKRQRGRRGLDMLERMRNCKRIKIQVVADDFAGIREVDLKLIELAKKYHGRLVTNDFNLNKVAQLHDIPVMNVNDLANTLRPVVLPGERLSIAILKEGKEPSQGIGYLNDGTMVVVDHARRSIGHTIDVQVTSVLQTPSGKMIFGRCDENQARSPESLATLSATGT